MIIGVGHDLCEIGRIRQLLEGNHGHRFVQRLLAAEEREHASRLTGERLTQFVAGRFAAKESVAKALGCGIGGVVGLNDICVLPGELGKPECRLSEVAWLRLGMDASAIRIHITITHERALASAFAVVEQL